MSERRDSDPRPSPWQGDAPPIELLSQTFIFYINFVKRKKILQILTFQQRLNYKIIHYVVPKVGLEPTSQVFQTSAVTILATSARSVIIISIIYQFKIFNYQRSIIDDPISNLSAKGGT